ISNVQLSVKKGIADFSLYSYGRKWTEMDGVSVYYSYTRGIPMMIKPNVERWVKTVRQMFDDYVQKYGCPDIIHAHCAHWAGYASMLIGHDYGIPYVITEHLSSYNFTTEIAKTGGCGSWEIPLIRKAYAEASIVLPVAAELTDNLAPIFGKEYRWKEMPNAIDTDFYAYRKREDWRISAKPYRIVCLANFIPLKGYDILLPAFKEFCKKHKNSRLDVLGFGTDSEEMQKMIRLFGVENVYCYGRVGRERVREVLYESNLLVLPSRSEAQPLSLLEAMSTGIPVVATEVTPRSLRIEGGCTVVPTDDVKALADAMEKACENVDFDGFAVSQNVRQIASYDVLANKLDMIFTDIIKNRK
ncbi:MAG: glycosyltransferase family 4 protein, partial [Bacteroidaceae bacterium]|nr:glycosyltransferase family 4 protein [Bacteroidaceae bacterium]